jgi:hypothetical protein
MPELPFDGTALSASDATIATYSRLQYPNPFFDLSRHYFPKTVKTLFKYCRIYFYQNEFIHNVIMKLAEYPVTDFIYSDLQDASVKKNYEELIDHYLNLKSFLIEVGLDYFTYGNCIISANMKFKRFLRCPICKHLEPAENIKFRWINFEFTGKCPNTACSTEGIKFDVVDKYLKSPKYLKFIKWAPENINIDYDELTGESRYFYTMNDKTNKAIREGKPDVVIRVPKIFIDAIKKSKKIELDPRNLFHLRRPTLSEEDQGWGKPLLLPTMKLLWYMQTLRRGNEAIVSDHLIPMRSMFPSSQGNLDPFTQLNMGQWRSQVEDQILKWRRDPNAIAVFPLPIGYQSLGGDARVLMVTPELKYLEESIINALGVPIEFIKGGSTWTSSSVSLRIVENHFLTYREELDKLMNYFIIPKIRYFLGYPPVKIEFKKFKMMDDVQTKEVMLQMAQLNKVSDTTLLTEFGLDATEERENRRQEIKAQNELQTEAILSQADAQGRAVQQQARYQIRAQYDAQEENCRVKERKFSKELISELQLTAQDPSDFLEKQSILIEGVDPKAGEQMLAVYQQQAPTAFAFLMKRIQMIRGIDPAAIAQQQLEMQGMKAQDQMAAKQHERDMEKAKTDEKSAKSDHERHIERTGVDMVKKEHDVEVSKEKAKVEANKPKEKK